MKINKGNINNNEDWVNVEDLGVKRFEGSTTATPEIAVFESSNAYGRKRLHNVNYTERNIEVHILVAETKRSDLIKKREEVISLLRGQFSMVLSNDPDRIYREVSVIGAVEIERISNTVELLKFDMKAYDPFRYGKDEKSYESSITGEDEILVINNGDFRSKPVVTISGAAEEISLSTAGRTTTIVDLNNETIEIDSEKLTVVDVDNNITALHKWRDNFIEVEPGGNSIKITGENIDVKITIKFRDTYL